MGYRQLVAGFAEFWGRRWRPFELWGFQSEFIKPYSGLSRYLLVALNERRF